MTDPETQEGRGIWPWVERLSRQVTAYCGGMLAGSAAGLTAALLLQMATDPPMAGIVDVILVGMLPLLQALTGLAMVSHVLPLLWAVGLSTLLFGRPGRVGAVIVGGLATLQVLVLTDLVLREPVFARAPHGPALGALAILGGGVAGAVYRHLSQVPGAGLPQPGPEKSTTPKRSMESSLRSDQPQPRRPQRSATRAAASSRPRSPRRLSAPKDDH